MQSSSIFFWVIIIYNDELRSQPSVSFFGSKRKDFENFRGSKIFEMKNFFVGIFFVIYAQLISGAVANTTLIALNSGLESFNMSSENNITTNEDKNTNFNESNLTIEQGIFFIHVTPGLCPKHYRIDKRGKCRKLARVQ